MRNQTKRRHCYILSVSAFEFQWLGPIKPIEFATFATSHLFVHAPLYELLNAGSRVNAYLGGNDYHLWCIGK